jgi:hypothetical protein
LGNGNFYGEIAAYILGNSAAANPIEGPQLCTYRLV